MKTARFTKILALFGCALLAVPVLWTLLSVFSVRFLVRGSSAPPDEFHLSDEAVFKISTQTLQLSADHGARTDQAAMAWVNGTDLFFTNRHVVNNICDNQAVCRFEASDAFDFLPTQRELRRRICLPGRDICVLTPNGEVPTLTSSEFALASVGETVYYVDREAPRLRLYEGEVTSVQGSAVEVKGYGRHGFSGTPLFNREGEIVGILSSSNDNLLLAIPHYLIFGWTQDSQFQAVSVADSLWMRQDQAELNESEWTNALRALAHELPVSPQACASKWATWKTIYRFGKLVLRWSDVINELPLSAVMQRLETASDTRGLCSKIVLESEAASAR